MLSTNTKNISSLLHLSTFSRFVFPFGNILAPVVLWSFNKDKSQFIDQNAKSIINFQLSIMVYTVILLLISIPFFIISAFNTFPLFVNTKLTTFHMQFNEPSTLLYFGGLLGLFAIGAFVVELLLIVLASLKARDGETYTYPLTINFLK